MAERRSNAFESRWLKHGATLGVVLAFTVVVLGAYTRLTDAGLGCPDWPGCYGYLSVPGAAAHVSTVEAHFPDAHFEARKAWPEMVHRYFAGSLGVLIFGLAVVAIRNRATGAPLKLSLLLAALVVLQAGFGMWTVTLKLWPQVVTIHLLGGFATLGLLWLLHLRLHPSTGALAARLRPHAIVALVAVIAQVTLGGWTTSNYAALACPDFPTCQHQWWPAMDAAAGFDFFQRIGPNYLGGLMDNTARIAIHMGHRIGALVVLLIVGTLVIRMWLSEGRRLAIVLLLLLAVQVTLGIANVEFTLPLAVATAHNAGGALLLLGIITVNYRTLRP